MGLHKHFVRFSNHKCFTAILNINDVNRTIIIDPKAKGICPLQHTHLALEKPDSPSLRFCYHLISSEGKKDENKGGMAINEGL